MSDLKIQMKKERDNRSNARKAEALGMSYGKARNMLNKSIMFNLIQKCGQDTCFQCGKKIENVDNLSVEHKTPWLKSGNSVDLFFDLDNIAFSHTSCNYAMAEKPMVKNKIQIGETGYRGVTKSDKKFRASITIKGKKISSIVYNTAKEAATRYDEMAIEYHGNKAITNKMLGLL